MNNINKIPKVHFIYSWSFDRFQKSIFETNNLSYPTTEQMLDDVFYIKNIWNKFNEGDKVIKGIIEILKVNLGYDLEFFVYGKGKLGAISVPLLLNLYPKEGERYSDVELLETITHELIHRFIASPRVESAFNTKKYWEYVRGEAYIDLHPSTQTHILLYAVLEKLRPAIFTFEQIEKINTYLSQPLKPGYREAIDIAKKQDPDLLIKEFTDRVVRYE